MRRTLLAAVTGLLLASCTGGRFGRAPRAYQDLTTASAACTKNPAGCAAMHGVAVETGVAKAAAVAMLATAVVAMEALDVATQAKVDQVLKECADLARSEVLIRRFGGRTPTADECNQTVRTPEGEDLPRYLWFGNEMHRVAAACVKEKLGKVMPGRFSVEQRYRYDLQTGKATILTAAEEMEIRRAGRLGELRGTIVPDVIIHNGDPRFIQAVYDFKFPCEDLENWRWRKYKDGPFAGKPQNQIYEDALGQTPAPVVPRLGVVR